MSRTTDSWRSTGADGPRILGRMDVPTITSSQNRQLIRVRRLVARPKECRREGLLIADGVHLVQEALKARLRCAGLFVTAGQRTAEIEAIVHEAEQHRLALYPVLPHLFRALSPVESPQGILGLFERPRCERSALWKDLPEGDRGHLVILDGVQDPTNVGSILRSAQAAGIRGLITTPHTVDPFHHRSLRAAMGAAFHLPIVVEEPVLPLLSTLRNVGYQTLALSAQGDRSISDLPRGRFAFLFGAEGSGLAAGVEAQCSLRVKIPMAREIDSLGVAAAAAVAFFSVYLRDPD